MRLTPSRTRPHGRAGVALGPVPLAARLGTSLAAQERSSGSPYRSLRQQPRQQILCALLVVPHALGRHPRPLDATALGARRRLRAPRIAVAALAALAALAAALLVALRRAEHSHAARLFRPSCIMGRRAQG